jgi:hypothetical protein
MLDSSKCAMQKKDSVELIIGYHQLEGQIVMLKKPLAMLERCCAESGEGKAVEYEVGQFQAFKEGCSEDSIHMQCQSMCSFAYIQCAFLGL